MFCRRFSSHALTGSYRKNVINLRSTLRPCCSGSRTRTAPVPTRQVKAKPFDSKITIARTPLQRTRTADEQNDLEAYLGLIGGTPALHCEVVGDLLRATNNHPKAYMASPADTLAIVQNIVRLSNAHRCIEIGVFTGVQHIRSLANGQDNMQCVSASHAS